MRMVLVPGYKELFGEPSKTYSEFLSEVPSEVIISILITINNELNAPLPETENQKRLKNLLSRNFSDEQLNTVNFAYRQYSQHTNANYKGDVFARHYLLSNDIERT